MIPKPGKDYTIPINGDQFAKCGEQRSWSEKCANAINVEANWGFSSDESEIELKIGNSGGKRRAAKLKFRQQRALEWAEDWQQWRRKARIKTEVWSANCFLVALCVALRWAESRADCVHSLSVTTNRRNEKITVYSGRKFSQGIVELIITFKFAYTAPR